MLFGSIRISETPKPAKLSDLAVQLTPLSVVFQIPPTGAPAYIVFSLVGSIATTLILPFPGNDAYPFGSGKFAGPT